MNAIQSGSRNNFINIPNSTQYHDQTLNKLAKEVSVFQGKRKLWKKKLEERKAASLLTLNLLTEDGTVTDVGICIRLCYVILQTRTLFYRQHIFIDIKANWSYLYVFQPIVVTCRPSSITKSGDITIKLKSVLNNKIAVLQFIL